MRRVPVAVLAMTAAVAAAICATSSAARAAHLAQSPGVGQHQCSIDVEADAGPPVLGCARQSAPGHRSAAHVASGSSTGAQACAPVPGVNDFCPVWTATYDNASADSVTNQTSGDDEPHVMRVFGNHVFIAGGSWVPSVGFQVFVAAYDRTTGALSWATRWLDPQNESDIAYALALDSTGQRLFISVDRCNGLCSLETIGYNAATGAELWEAPYHDSSTGNDEVANIAVSPDGSRVFITGGEQPQYATSGNASVLTIAYDAGTGAQDWLQTYAGPVRSDGENLNDGRRVIVDAASDTVYVGATTSGAGAQQYLTTAIAYDATTGAQRWISRYAHQTVDTDSDMTLSNDGSTLYLTGLDRLCGSSGCTVPDDSYATVALDARSGAQLWSAVQSNIGVAERMALSPDGTTVYVTGIGYGATGNNYMATTVALDGASGAQRWLVSTNPSGGDGWAQWITAMQNPPTAVITIVSIESGAVFQTVALDEATGSTTWSALYNPAPANDTANPWLVTSTPDGWVYVAGILGQEVDPITGANNDIDAQLLGYQVGAPSTNVPEAPLGGAALLLIGGATAISIASRSRRRRA